MKRLFTVLLTLLAMSAPAAADMVKTVNTEYYTVQGTSPAAIYKDLKRNSPLNKGSKTYQAHTRTSIKYQFKWHKRGNACSMKEVTVYLHLTYLYPRLARSVDRKTRNWWKEYLAKLEEHELIHGEISIKAAHALSDTLETMQTEKCADFKAIVKERAQQIMDKLKIDHTAYDKLTEHGLKQERNRGRYP